jgi:epoxide hydrolase-like predicted phosphatase
MISKSKKIFVIMLSMYKVVIFDFGGVMHNVDGLAAERQEVYQALGIEDNLEAQAIQREYLKKLGAGELTEEDYWSLLTQALSVQIPENYQELYRKTLREDSAHYPEMFELVNTLKNAGFKVVVLSNSIPPHAEVLQAKGWYEPFDKVFLSQDIGVNKPEPKAFEKVLEEMKVDPIESVFIDDLEENLLPAKDLGITTIHAKSPKQVIADIEKLLNLVELN